MAMNAFKPPIVKCSQFWLLCVLFKRFGAIAFLFVSLTTSLKIVGAKKSSKNVQKSPKIVIKFERVLYKSVGPLACPKMALTYMKFGLFHLLFQNSYLMLV